jgi:hypothetical protein
MADTSAAATAAAWLWAGYYQNGAARPKVELRAPTPVTVGDRQGSFVIATVRKPAGSCGAATAEMLTVALPGRAGESVVFVLLADTGVLTGDDVERMASSIRPAGQPAKCDPIQQVTGSWC